MILRGHSERLGLLHSRVTTEFCPETLEGALKTGLSRVNVMAKQVGLDLRIATLPIFPIFYNWFCPQIRKTFFVPSSGGFSRFSGKRVRKNRIFWYGCIR